MVYKRFTLFTFLIGKEKGAPFIRLKLQYVIVFPWQKTSNKYLYIIKASLCICNLSLNYKHYINFFSLHYK